MALMRYAGPGPQDDGRGGLVRPGDVWDWPGEPTWGPWERLDGPESAGESQATQVRADDAGSAAAASAAADADGSAPAGDAGTEA